MTLEFQNAKEEPVPNPEKVIIQYFIPPANARMQQQSEPPLRGKCLLYINVGSPKKTFILRRMKELGLEYRHLAWQLEGKLTKDEMIERLDAAIRNYAKRQLRYLRRNKKIIWIQTEREALARTKEFLDTGRSGKVSP